MKNFNPLKTLLKRFIFPLLFTGLAIGVTAQVAVTFQVDMRNEQLNGQNVFVVINGFYNNIPQLMSDNDGNNIYELTQFFAQTTQLQYRFMLGEMLEGEENLGACAEPIGPINEIYRIFNLDNTNESVVIPLVCFEFCDPCGIGTIGTPTYVDACIGQQVELCITDPMVLAQDYQYQWFEMNNGNPIPVSSLSPQPCYTPPTVTMQSPLVYFCQISTTAGETFFVTEPYILVLLEEDAIGGKYFANQFLIKFLPGVDEQQRQMLREDFQATLLDECMCEYELWEIPDGIEYPPGSGNPLIDDETKKDVAKEEPEVEEVDLNYKVEEYALANSSNSLKDYQKQQNNFLNTENTDFSACTALGFDGNIKHVRIPSQPLNTIDDGDFTFEAWIKGDEASQAQNPVIFANRPNEEEGTMFFLANYSGASHRALALQLKGSNYLDTSSPLVLDDQSHHIAISREGNRLHYYVDGYLSHTKVIGPAESILTNQDLWIGLDPITPSSTAFNGLLEEIRIWSHARSATDILRDAKIRLTGTETGLVAYWDFKEGSGQIVSDKTVNAHNGYLGNSLAMDNADPIWLSSCCFQNPVLTAIIDGGIQYDHPDLGNKIWINPEEATNGLNGIDDDINPNCAIDDIVGYNYANDDNNPTDLVKGHGTHVAGLAVQAAEGGFNIPNANVLELLNLKSLKDEGKSDLFDAVCSVLHAADKQAKVINCSWGYYGLPSALLYQAFDIAAQNCGALVITSAGNSGFDVLVESHYPGNYNEAFLNMIQVGAIDTIDNSEYDYTCYALDFDGLSQFVTIQDPVVTPTTISSDFTFEAWIKGNLTQQNRNPLIFTNRIMGQEGIALYFKDNGLMPTQKHLTLQVGDTEYIDFSYPDAFDGLCHHIAVVRQSDFLHFYFDGILSNTIEIEPLSTTNVHNELYIGLEPSDPMTYGLNGTIEEIRLWETALNSEQITEAATNTNPAFLGLLAHWKFNMNDAQIVEDKGPSNFPGFLGDTPGMDSVDPLWTTDCCVIDAFLINENKSLELAVYSNFNENMVNITVPGLQNSTVPIDNQGLKVGTSMAAGYLSGIAARLFYENPAAQWPDVKQCILDNSSTLASLTGLIENQRYFDRPIDLDGCIDCIRNINPDATDCTYLIPLSTTSFELRGEWQERGISLEWEIFTSKNIALFEIERLNSFGEWEKIMVQTSDLNIEEIKQIYNVLDTHPQEGDNFYRIKAIFEDQTNSFSNIIKISPPEKNNSFIVFPNPSHNFLNLGGQFGTTTSVDILNTTGILLNSFEIQPNKTLITLDIRTLPAGFYFLNIKDADEIVEQHKFVVVRK